MSNGDLSEGAPTLTRGKLMLIGTLGSTLLSVLWFQFSGEEEADVKPAKKGAPAAKAPANPGTQVASAKKIDASLATKPEQRVFPTINRAEALQFDPFGMSEAFAKKYAAAASTDPNANAEALRKQEEQKKYQTLRQQALNKLLEQGVAVVVRGENGPAATIGTRLVHEGDVIDGFRIDKIDADGVVLKEAPLP